MPALVVVRLGEIAFTVQRRIHRARALAQLVDQAAAARDPGQFRVAGDFGALHAVTEWAGGVDQGLGDVSAVESFSSMSEPTWWFVMT